MEELVERISQATGLDRARAEKALGITLSLIRAQGNPAKVDELFAKLPGASELAERSGAGASRGGLLGILGGGMMGAPLAAVAKLTAAGLSMDQVKVLGAEVLGHARKVAGEDLVREVASSIPGLAGHV